MAEKADFVVTNKSKVTLDIFTEVNGKRIPRGALKRAEISGKIPLINSKESLVVKPRGPVNFENCYILVEADDVDVVKVKFSVTRSCWIFGLPPSNATGVDSPATVNVTYGEDESDTPPPEPPNTGS